MFFIVSLLFVSLCLFFWMSAEVDSVSDWLVHLRYKTPLRTLVLLDPQNRECRQCPLTWETIELHPGMWIYRSP